MYRERGQTGCDLASCLTELLLDSTRTIQVPIEHKPPKVGYGSEDAGFTLILRYKSEIGL